MVVDDTGLLLAWKYWQRHEKELRYFSFRDWLKAEYGIISYGRHNYKQVQVVIGNEENYLVFKLKFG